MNPYQSTTRKMTPPWIIKNRAAPLRHNVRKGAGRTPRNRECTKPAGLQRAHSIAQGQHCAGVLAQAIRESAPRGFLPVKNFLLIPSERPIGVKNIRRLARKPCRKALRAKAKSPGILKRAQLRFQHHCRIFAILHAAQQRLRLFCNNGSHGSGKRRFAIGNRALRVRILAKQDIERNLKAGKLIIDIAALLSRSE
jgi:hypothetical protein